jgi:hypothetical protein
MNGLGMPDDCEKPCFSRSGGWYISVLSAPRFESFMRGRSSFLKDLKLSVRSYRDHKMRCARETCRSKHPLYVCNKDKGMRYNEKSCGCARPRERAVVKVSMRGISVSEIERGQNSRWTLKNCSCIVSLIKY